MECTFVGIVEEANKVCLRSLLEGKEGRALHSQIRLYVTSNLADKTLEGCLPHQKFRVLLVFTDLTKGDGPRAPTTGFSVSPILLIKVKGTETSSMPLLY